MAYRQRNRNRRRRTGSSSLNKTFLAVLIMGVALSLLGAFAFIDVRETKKRANIDSSTFCQKNILPQSTVILIDHTDRINPTQRAALEARLWDIANAVPKNGSIKVFSVDQVKNSVLTPEIELCNPGDEEDVDELTGNKRLAHNRYEDRFRKPIGQLLNKVFDEETASQSPIMEALQSVVVTSFIGSKNNASQKKLVLVSDLLEYTPEFSLYKSVPTFDEYKRSSHWPRVKSDLAGVDVEIFFLHRAGLEKQTSALVKFWVDFFTAQGAVVQHTVPIEG